MTDFESGERFSFEPPKIRMTDLSLMEAAAVNAEIKKDFEAFSRLISTFSELDTSFGPFSAGELAMWLSERVNDGMVWLGPDFQPQSVGLRYGIYPLIEKKSEKPVGQAMRILLPRNFAEIAPGIMPFQIGRMLQDLKEYFDKHNQDLKSRDEIDLIKNWLGPSQDEKVVTSLQFVEARPGKPEFSLRFDPFTGEPMELVSPEREKEVMEWYKEKVAKYPELVKTSPIFGKYRVIGSRQRKRLFGLGYKEKLPWLKTIGDARLAMGAMPPEKKGVVVGSGEKTAEWHRKGWQTADINKSRRPDIVTDANFSLAQVGKGNYDYILGERMPGMGSTPGINFHDFVNQARRALRPGGILIMDTINHSQEGKAIPNLQEMGRLLEELGFDFTAELVSFTHPEENIPGGGPFQQRVIYYARKPENN